MKHVTKETGGGEREEGGGEERERRREGITSVLIYESSQVKYSTVTRLYMTTCTCQCSCMSEYQMKEV